MTSTSIESDIVEFLSGAAAWGSGAVVPEMIETHISRVFLIGNRAFKQKRHVKFPYLDFTTLSRRKSACLAEVAVNRRTAPDLYKGIVPVTRDRSGKFGLNGPGERVDWLVEMVRFDQQLLFDRLAARGRLGRSVMERTADVIAGFHDRAETVVDARGYASVDQTITSNHKCFASVSPACLSFESLRSMDLLYDQRMKACGDFLDRRADAGLMRHCHGDLHLRNICLYKNQPTLFDAIEFNAAFSHIDVLYDLAFLLMDLDFHEQRRLANVVMNRYFDVSGRAGEDPGNFNVLPLFLSMRAAVRSHVIMAQEMAAEHTVKKSQQLEIAQAYFRVAINYLVAVPPRLIAIGGLSGSGKSTLARLVAPTVGAAPGGRIVRSDVIRKRLAGCPLSESLDATGYSPEMTGRTYHAFYEEIQKCLVEGQSVIADAVCVRPEERQMLAGIAEKVRVPFDGFWLDASLENMQNRVSRRTDDVSDATVAVVAQQQNYDLGEVSWRRFNNNGSPATLQGTLACILSRVMP